MSNEYRIISPPEMAQLMYDGKTLEFRIGGVAYWDGEGFRFKRGGLDETLQDAWNYACRIKVESKPKLTFRPFDRVLVRDCPENAWHAMLYSHGTNCGGIWWRFIAPYEGNERFVGTTEDIPGSWGSEENNE